MLTTRVCAGCQKKPQPWLLRILISHMLLVFFCQHTCILWISQVILEYIQCHQLLWKFLLIISLDHPIC